MKNPDLNKNWATIAIIVLLLLFIGYIVVDVAIREETPPDDTAAVPGDSAEEDPWMVVRIFEPGKGQLNAIASGENGSIIVGGELFITCYDSAFRMLWDYKPEMPVTALSAKGGKTFAAIQSRILVLDADGKPAGEWGPYESDAYITSISAGETKAAIADAANKKVYIVDMAGAVISISGKPEDPFIIPSFYFDVALENDEIFHVANTGNRRIEKRSTGGEMISYIGKPGTENDAFCGCCNPAHFIVVPDGFITAEKGINRIKIVDRNGEFREYISSVDRFVPALPLDIASPDGQVVYGANPADSKVYVFRRR